MRSCCLAGDNPEHITEVSRGEYPCGFPYVRPYMRLVRGRMGGILGEFAPYINMANSLPEDSLRNIPIKETRNPNPNPKAPTPTVSSSATTFPKSRKLKDSLTQHRLPYPKGFRR